MGNFKYFNASESKTNARFVNRKTGIHCRAHDLCKFLPASSIFDRMKFLNCLRVDVKTVFKVGSDRHLGKEGASPEDTLE